MHHKTQYETDDKAFPADAYKVKGHGGVAWRVYGWETESYFEEYETECWDCNGAGELPDYADLEEQVMCKRCDGSNDTL